MRFVGYVKTGGRDPQDRMMGVVTDDKVAPLASIDAFYQDLSGWRQRASGLTEGEIPPYQRGIQPGLCREDYVGLYGELSFIEAALNKGLAPLDVINSWQGPLGTNQDFLFGPKALETKTTTGNEINNVRITNIRQLDSTGLQALFLARYAFDFRQGAGRTLPQLVAVIKHALSAVPEGDARSARP